MNFRTRLLARERLVGTLVTMADADAAEVLGGRGLDWLFLDEEHGALDRTGVRAVLRAVRGRTACVVRVAALDHARIAQALDAGADGVIVPQIRSAEEAAQAVAFGRYPPLGTRGLGAGRAQGHGLDGGGYLGRANDDVAVIVQAETAGALREIDAIARTPGLDGVLIGPYDLSASLGIAGQFTHPDFVAAVTRISDACRTAAMPVGVFGMTAEAVRPYVAQGATLLVAGVDTALLGHAADAMGDALRAL
jgi:2-keto-3-deoxy-L-rhamnonate aldolase RhmA